MAVNMKVDCDRYFGNCLVDWKIENFCLATCEDNYTIQSSEFRVKGPESTRWRLAFTPKMTNTTCMVVYVERLNDSGPSTVYANWSLMLEALNEECFYQEYTHEFQNLTKKRIDVYSLPDILSTLQPFSPDTVLIRFHLIIQHRDKAIRSLQPKTVGLVSLSDKLGLMFKSSKDTDFVITVGKKQIFAHKAILSRNAVLDCLINESRDNKIEIQDTNYLSAARYLDFLYTGDLDKIHRNFSIAMHKLLTDVDKDLLNCYFPLEEVDLHTKIEIEDVEHLWMLSCFGIRSDPIFVSPVFKKMNVDTTWQLQLKRSEPINSHYLSVYADIVKGKKPSNLCLEFSLEDKAGEMYYPSRILSSNGKCDFGVKEFVKTACLQRVYTSDEDTLNLLFKARTWDGAYYSKISNHMISFVTNSKESTYERMSKGMLKVFQLGAYSDITIEAAEFTFKAHKCVLSARSPILCNRIKNLGDKTVLFLDDISPLIVGRLLEYIYSGVLPKLNLRTLEMLVDAAGLYNIASLKMECEQKLKAFMEDIEKGTFSPPQDSENSPEHF